MNPKRIQRRRTKGWRMPEGAVYVGRPTRWGNPLTVEGALDSGYATSVREARGVCFDGFEALLTVGRHWALPALGHSEQRAWILDHLHELAGRDLVCWCPWGEACHADVLLKLANRPEDGAR